MKGKWAQPAILFAHLKDSMELLADLDPEEARALVDPVPEHMIYTVRRYAGTAGLPASSRSIIASFSAHNVVTHPWNRSR